jgi:glyoxylase-like metal-dependent hydrolase (beta-lactamase superfamily II)
MIVTGTAQKERWDQREWPPTEQVRDGLWSLPVPIPGNPLRYVLCYVVVTSDGPVLVDPGWPTGESWRALTKGLRQIGFTPADVQGVLITHYHADHYGLAHQVREESGAWVAMHTEDADLGHEFAKPDAEPRDRAWTDTHGVPAEVDLTIMAGEDFAMLRDHTSHLPDHRLAGRKLSLSGWNVEAVWTPGHTPGHLCFWLPDERILLTGDHLLPRISSNISLTPTDHGDPLGNYLDSLALLDAFGDAEALPAHEYRFGAIPERAAHVRRHHEERLSELEELIDVMDPSSAFQLAPHLRWARPWDGSSSIMQRFALGETAAHLRHLEVLGRIRAYETADGVRIWTRPS